MDTVELRFGEKTLPLREADTRTCLAWWRAWSAASEMDKTDLEAAIVGLLAVDGYVSAYLPRADGQHPPMLEYGRQVWRDLEVYSGLGPVDLLIAIQPASRCALARLYPSKKKIDEAADFSKAPGAAGSPGPVSPASGSETPPGGVS